MTLLACLALGYFFTASWLVAHRLGMLEERCRWQATQIDIYDGYVEGDDPDPGEDIPEPDLGENVVAIGKEAA